MNTEQEQFTAFLRWWHRNVHAFAGPIKPADVDLCEAAEQEVVAALHSGKE